MASDDFKIESRFNLCGGYHDKILKTLNIMNDFDDYKISKSQPFRN